MVQRYQPARCGRMFGALRARTDHTAWLRPQQCRWKHRGLRRLGLSKVGEALAESCDPVYGRSAADGRTVPPMTCTSRSLHGSSSVAEAACTCRADADVHAAGQVSGMPCASRRHAAHVRQPAAWHLNLVGAPEGAFIVEGPRLHEPHSRGIDARHSLRSLQTPSRQTIARRRVSHNNDSYQ